MLKLSKLLKSIFRSIIIILLILEIILLMSILLIYRSNTEGLKKGLQINIKNGITQYRDLFVTYLADKYYMLSEDLIMMLRTFESIRNNTNYSLNKNRSLIESNCVINGQKIFSLRNSSDYYSPWYYTKEENLQSRLLGTWYTTRSNLTLDDLSNRDLNFIYTLCSMNRLFKDILVKHLNWRDHFGVTNEWIYFAFSDSFFVKFPSFNNSYMSGKASDFTDTMRNDISICNTTRDIHTYDPVCRTYYKDTMNSPEKIVISSPYRFASSGLYGSSLCAKGLKIDNERNRPEVVICIDYNFKDMDTFGNVLQSFLLNKRIFIVQMVDKTIKVIFSTSVNSSDFNSFGMSLKLNNNEGNDFFEVLNFNSFKSMNASIDYTKIDLVKLGKLNYTDINAIAYIMKNSTYTDDEKKYIDFCQQYTKMKMTYQSIIMKNISDFMSKNNENLIEPNLTSLNETYEFSNKTSSIIKTNNIMEIYTLPIRMGFDYYNDYNIIKNNKIKFYFIFVQNPDSIDIIDSLYLNIVFSLLFSFISLSFLNIIIWVVLGSCYYFYFKAIFTPLKKINRDFKDLVFIDEKNLDSLKKNDKYAKSSFQSKTSKGFISKCQNKILRFLQKRTINLMEYHEIYDSLITIKLLRTIREYKLVSSKNFNLNKENCKEDPIDGIMKSFMFLMFKLGEEILYDIHFDSRLISDLIYHNFMFKIVNDHSEKNVGFFYEYFTNLIDKTIEYSKKNFRKVQKLEKLSTYEKNRKAIDNKYVDVDKFFTKQAGLTNLKDIYENLKEAIHYRYCVYKLKKMEKEQENDFEDKNVCNSSSDEEEDKTNDFKCMTTEREPLNKIMSFTSLKQRPIIRQSFNIEENNISFYSENSDSQEKIKGLVNDFLKYLSMIKTNEITFDTLRQISVHIILANLYNQIKKESECLKQCTLAMEKIKSMQDWVSTLGNLTKFSFLSICVLFYEKIFFIFSNLSEKFDQKKTQFFIYLKLLDLGPIFDSRIRISVFQNIMDFMHKELKKQPIKKIRNESDEQQSINSMIIRHKIRAMMNMTMKVSKYITYLIDVNCPFLLEKDFKYMFEKICLAYSNLTINFALFNEELILNKTDVHSDYNFLFSIDQNDYRNKTSNLDKAIFDTLNNFIYHEYPKNNNYLYVLTNIDANFDFSLSNLSKISIKIFKEKYSLIILLFWDDKIYDSPLLKKKLNKLRMWIESNSNGIMIIIKNYSVIQYLMTCIHPIKFKEFDPIVLKNLVTSIDLNLHLEEFFLKKNTKSALKSNNTLRKSTQVLDKKHIQINMEDESLTEEMIYFNN